MYILLILPRSTCGASVGSSATVLLPLLETTCFQKLRNYSEAKCCCCCNKSYTQTRVGVHEVHEMLGQVLPYPNTQKCCGMSDTFFAASQVSCDEQGQNTLCFDS